MPTTEDARKGGVLFFKNCKKQMKLIEFTESLGAFYRQKDIDKEVTSLSTLLDKVMSYYIEKYDLVDDAEFAAVKYMAHLKPAERKVKLRSYLETQLKRAKDLIIGACAYGSLDGKENFYFFFFKKDGGLVNEFYASTIDTKKYFYRMRGSENYQVYNRMDLFVIPDNIIRLVGKQRFNQDGIPCLYLGESLYCAWEEVRRKDFEQVNFSGFTNTRSLKVLDLTIKSNLLRKEDFILAFFALLVSGKVVDKDAHKYQYDVSNLVMDVLQASITKGGDVDGIRYMSSRRYDGMELYVADTNKMYGYVFPPKGGAKVGDLDKWMRDTFKLTEPRTSFMYDVHRIDFDRTRTAITRDYQNTLFYKIEEQLKKEAFDYCDK